MLQVLGLLLKLRQIKETCSLRAAAYVCLIVIKNEPVLFLMVGDDFGTI
jgi:hypothetical protein